ncbi:MAG: hypothetical protein ACRDU9_06310, partial [Acidimicrobiia bacterium]
MIDAESIKRVAMQAGADVVGITSADPFDEALVTISDRKRAGMAGPLHFTYDDPGTASDVKRSFP